MPKLILPVPEYIAITSEFLQLTEPYLKEYFGIHSLLLLEEIKTCVENSGIDYIIPNDNNELTVNYVKTFYEHENLWFSLSVPYKQVIHEHEELGKYFQFRDGTILPEDAMVLFCLNCVAYLFHKNKKNTSESYVSESFDLEYECYLQNRIYPEILSLYKMILDLKGEENRDSEMTITHKGSKKKVNVNTFSWFLDDMEKYFTDRFPDLTLEKINQILNGYKGKAGSKHKDPIITNIIWGTYHLLRNHHSKFKNIKDKTSKEIGEFIISYLDYLDAEHDYTAGFEINGILKYYFKVNYVPDWFSDWDILLSDIKEKQPKNIEERMNTPLYRYNIEIPIEELKKLYTIK